MSQLSDFTVLVEPDPSKLDAAFTNQDFPLELFPSGFPKSMSTIAKNILHEESRLSFERIVNGDNYYLVVRSVSQGPTNLWIEIRLDDKEEWTTVPPFAHFCLIDVGGGNFNCKPEYLNKDFSRHAPDYAMFAVIERTMQWLLRQHLSKMSIAQIHMVFMTLMSRCSGSKHWKDLYETMVLRCKWIFAERPGGENSVLSGINKIGEALESMKQYPQAAVVYREGSNLVDDVEDQSRLIRHAGLAFKRNLDYQEAEVLYLRSIRICLEHETSKFSPNQKSTPSPLARMQKLLSLQDEMDPWSSSVSMLLVLYYEWSCSQHDVHTKAIERSDEWELQIPLLALLHDAGWLGNGDSARVKQGKEFCKRGVLKKEFRNRKKALLQLHKAFLSSDDRENFRRLILDVRNTSVTDLAEPGMKNPGEFNFQQYTKEALKAKSKAAARGQVTPKNGLVTHYKCANCHTRLTEPKRCPCQTAFYCNRECQTKHWTAEHKKVCPLRKQKK